MADIIKSRAGPSCLNVSRKLFTIANLLMPARSSPGEGWGSSTNRQCLQPKAIAVNLNYLRILILANIKAALSGNFQKQRIKKQVYEKRNGRDEGRPTDYLASIGLLEIIKGVSEDGSWKTREFFMWRKEGFYAC
ncbi:MAG: hypothetical protein KA099_03700 [Alphaproteobacteria bacterium]|nr:hypothetical protein [Alphaproteobacteria bacterium]MBP7758435.1 hypothetical protein [Alphaproteobacteria bacterium]MBP7762716.1 hypothetical protein [Alphaproteobacteria bacterium]MBP7904410.1 hypothetical protein [Alphaproteobacteria bacterium]